MHANHSVHYRNVLVGALRQRGLIVVSILACFRRATVDRHGPGNRGKPTENMRCLLPTALDPIQTESRELHNRETWG
jgi:hypothetical protein